MSNLALRVEGLGKMYRIGGKQERYATLRDTLTDAVAAPFKRARSLLRGEAYGAAGLKEEIWALKDVSFEVQHGEVVGIIGRNGAGKSTLLKVLSRITEPTEGYAEVYGRVGSLLEVGTGFHPELTGRENIYLNGAILGMSREEINRKFDEIVDFAGVERFIDTPVKHYSSGMGLRLGFSVAAHLEPEILVVDEVLAVGDAEFQKKCLGKMSDVAGEGRTVLFVSHNMAAVESLCSRVMLLQNGVVIRNGGPQDTIRDYLESTSVMRAVVDLSNHPARKEKNVALLSSLRILDRDHNERSRFRPDESILLEINLSTRKGLHSPHVGIGINNWIGQRMFTVSTRLQNRQSPSMKNSGKFLCCIPPSHLMPGLYSLKITVGNDLEDLDTISEIPGFEIVPSDLYGTGRTPHSQQGVIYVIPEWDIRID